MELISREQVIATIDSFNVFESRSDQIKLELMIGELPIAGVGTDCISRQAAIDALRYAQHRFTVADEAGGMGTVKWSEYVIYFAAAERVLSDLPSAQPEIIRCKDCKHWDGVDTCDVIDAPVWDNDFCSFAERREVTT